MKTGSIFNGFKNLLYFKLEPELLASQQVQLNSHVLLILKSENYLRL